MGKTYNIELPNGCRLVVYNLPDKTDDADRILDCAEQVGQVKWLELWELITNIVIQQQKRTFRR